MKSYSASDCFNVTDVWEALPSQHNASGLRVILPCRAILETLSDLVTRRSSVKSDPVGVCVRNKRKRYNSASLPEKDMSRLTTSFEDYFLILPIPTIFSPFH